MKRWVLACLLVASVAHADDRATAKKLYDQGLAHYNVAEYPAAIDAWKQAYLLSKKPILLFNIAQAYRLAGDCKQAQTFYDSYERDEPHPGNQDELDQAIALCKSAPVPVVVEPPKPAPPFVVVEPPPAPAPAVVVSPPPPAPAPERPNLLPVYIAGGAGVVFGITGVIFALDARAQANHLDGVTAWTSADNDIQSRGKRDEKLAIVCGALGVAGIATGAVLYVLGEREVQNVAVAPTNGGLTASFSHSF